MYALLQNCVLCVGTRHKALMHFAVTSDSSASTILNFIITQSQSLPAYSSQFNSMQCCTVQFDLFWIVITHLPDTFIQRLIQNMRCITCASWSRLNTYGWKIYTPRSRQKLVRLVVLPRIPLTSLLLLYITMAHYVYVDLSRDTID